MDVREHKPACHLLSRRSLPIASGIDTEFWNGPAVSLIEKIRQESEKDVYIAGGGRIVSRFLEEGLVDEIYQCIVPVIITDGIPLYTGLRQEFTLDLIEAVTYSTGIVKLRYVPRTGSRKMKR